MSDPEHYNTVVVTTRLQVLCLLVTNIFFSFFLQCQCFNSPLENNEVFEVKNCVKRNMPDGLKDGGLTPPGKSLYRYNMKNKMFYCKWLFNE